MKRGELWTVAGGIYASKPRPAVIVQDDVFELTESVTVAPLTTTLTDAPLLRLRVPAGGLAGLTQDMMKVVWPWLVAQLTIEFFSRRSRM